MHSNIIDNGLVVAVLALVSKIVGSSQTNGDGLLKTLGIHSMLSIGKDVKLKVTCRRFTTLKEICSGLVASDNICGPFFFVTYTSKFY